MVLVSVERLDHFGIVSSVIKDLGIIESKYSVNPSLPSEKNSMFQKNLV